MTAMKPTVIPPDLASGGRKGDVAYQRDVPRSQHWRGSGLHSAPRTTLTGYAAAACTGSEEGCPWGLHVFSSLQMMCLCNSC